VLIVTKLRELNHQTLKKLLLQFKIASNFFQLQKIIIEGQGLIISGALLLRRMQ
jgi:hypothetical protein